jgi:hypothetical protein
MTPADIDAVWQRIRNSKSSNSEFDIAAITQIFGRAMTPRRRVKLYPIESKLTQVKVRLKKVVESPLLIVQKIDAMKTLSLTLDIMVPNDDVGENQLVMRDKHTRGVIDEVVKVSKL